MRTQMNQKLEESGERERREKTFETCLYVGLFSINFVPLQTKRAVKNKTTGVWMEGPAEGTL